MSVAVATGGLIITLMGIIILGFAVGTYNDPNNYCYDWSRYSNLSQLCFRALEEVVGAATLLLVGVALGISEFYSWRRSSGPTN